MRTGKVLAALVGGILVLVAAVLLAVWLLVNPNDYKARIAAAVKESTGRELMLPGDIKLSVFPWVALELGPASLGNPPGFGSEPMLAFQHAAVRVKLLPILFKRFEIDKVQIDGLDVRLRKNDQGVGNWENFGKAQEDDTHAKAGAGPKGNGALTQVGGLSVSDGRLSYAGVVVEKFNLEIGAFGGGGVTPISITFDANRAVPDETVNVNAKFALSADAQHKRLQLAAVNVSGLLSRPGDGRPAHWEMSAPAMDLDLGAQTLAVPAFELVYSSAHLSGKLQASKIFDDLAATGSVTLAPVMLREFAPRLGLALPKTRDPRALGTVSARSDFNYGAGGLRLEQLQVQLDDTTLKGALAWVGTPSALKFDLTVDQIDVDRYLGGEAAATSAGQGAPTAAREGGSAASKPMDADGSLSVGAVHFSNLEFTALRVTLGSTGGVVHLYPLQAQIDGGRYAGDITLDAHGATPTLSLDEHLSGIDVSRLLANGAYQGRLSGHGSVNLKATAQGAALEAFLRTLNGHFDANLTDGAIEGVDLGYELARAQALIAHQPAAARENTRRTTFDAFKMSAEINNGVATTSDLWIASQVLRVTGQGSAALPTKTIDMRLLASILKSPTATMADIPVKVTGSLMDPTVRPDVEELAKGQLKQKLKDVLKKNGLDGLFGK